MWFTEEDASQIGRVNMAGAIAEFSAVGCCFPTGISAGPDGNIWYTLEIGDQIGRITPQGSATQFTIQNVQVLPWDIVPGPDGNLWFTELAGRAVGTITTSGAIIEYPVPGAFSGIAGIAAGSDGNLWFTENDTNQISGMTPAGVMMQTLPTGDRPLSVCVGPDGNMWYTVADGNKIGRLTIAQANTRYVISMDQGFVPPVRNAAIGDTVKWIFEGPGVHSVFDNTAQQLFASGPKSIVSYFTYVFHAAGGYSYKDGFGLGTRGGINVPVTLPASGTVGTPFQVTWAAPSMPAGFTEDLLVQVPGSANFAPWITSSAASAAYTPGAPGVYFFRARMRNIATGASSYYARPASITVL
jgi:plastocyanin